MRRIIFLVPVLLCTIANGQNDQTFINANWHSTNQVNELDNLNSIHAANNLGFTLNASNYALDGSLAYRLDCLNDMGDIMWQTSFDEPALGQCTHSVLFDNGQSLVAGYTPDSADLNIQRARIQKLNEMGEESWSILDTADEMGSSFTSSLCLSSDSSIWHSVVSWGIDSGPTSRVQQLTQDGDILWTISISGLIVSTQIFGSNARLLLWQQEGVNWSGSLLKCNSLGEIVGEIDLDQSIETPEGFSAFEQDGNGNSVVVCKSSIPGNTSIVVWSLSNSFDLNWTNTYHVPGTDLSPQAVAIDDSGDIYVGGMAQENDGPQRMMLSHIQTDGTLISLHTQAHAEGLDQYIVNLQSHAGQQIAQVVSQDGNCILLGFEGNEIEWSRNVGKDVLPKSIGLLSSGERIYQNWSDSTGLDHRESLSFHTLTNTLSSEGDFMANQLVVKFDPSVVDLSFVENKDMRFGRLHEVVGQVLVEQLSIVCGVDLGQKCTAVKIFPGFTPSLPNSINRNGREIANPDFWACFRLDFSQDINESLVSQLLNDGSSAIRYCEVNPVIHLMNEPNDSLFQMQTSLGEFNEMDGETAFKGMDLNGAWNYAIGSEDIKVGVFDDMIYWGHEDFGDGSLSGSVVKGGYDFVNGQDIATASTPSGSHGTAVAGIIGAKRNNEIGVAGIAGGDIEASTDGVSLYSLGIFSGNSFVNELSTATQAIVESSFDNPESDYGYGLHVQNHSWGTWLDSELLRESITFAWRNNSIVVAARGNSGDESLIYPSCFLDDQVISVGACDEEGELQAGYDNDANSSFGQNMDILAPGRQQQIWTTIYSDEPLGGLYETTLDDQYSRFNNTSAAAAHVSGVCALAVEVCLENTPYSISASSEDMEYMIQYSGKDNDGLIVENYDQNNAWGWLDAHYLVSRFSFPFGFIRHFEFNELTLQNSSVGSSLYLQNEFDGLEPGQYFGDLYEYESTENFDIPEGYELISHWARPSATLGLTDGATYNGNLYDSDYQLVQQGDQISIQNNLKAFHIVSDGNGASLDIWIPAPPVELRAGCSAYFSNPDAISIQEIRESSPIKVFPCPTRGTLKVTWGDLEIQEIVVYSLLGQALTKEVLIPGSKRCQLNIESLIPGPYIMSLRTSQQHFTTTIIKIE